MYRYTFGPFVLVEEQHVVYKDGELLAMTPQVFETLLLLVENGGEVVSREALRQRVWGDSFVEEANISKSVSLLRGLLRPHLGGVNPIKTVAKRGYQLLPLVVRSAVPDVASPLTPVMPLDLQRGRVDPLAYVESSAAPARPFSVRANRWALGAALAVVLVIVAVSSKSHWGHSPWFLAGTLSPMALTPGNDLEAMPAVSPAGRTLAYVTRRPDSPHFKIYVRPLADRGSFGQPLDTGAGEAFYPSWSPDGRTLAFLRCTPGLCEICTLPATSGAVHVVRAMPRFSLVDDRPYYIYLRLNPVWTPDGRSIIFPYRDLDGDSQRLVRHDLDTDAEEVLTSGKQWEEDHAPALSPDGKSLAFFRANLSYADVMQVDLKTHRQTTVASHLSLPTNGLTWSPDGHGMVISRQEPNKPWALWWISLSGISRQLPVALESPQAPVFTPDGTTLMVLSVDRSQSLAVVTDENPSMPHELFTSHQHDLSVAFAPDGRDAAFLSDRSGSTEVWLAEVTAEGALHNRQLTHGLAAGTSFLSWSPRGQKLVLSSGKERGSVWIVDVHTGEVTTIYVPQLTRSLIFSPVWAEDEKSLYVAVSGDHSGIFRIGLENGFPVQQLVEDHTWLLQIDGARALYYIRRSGTGLYRINLQVSKPVAEPVDTFRKVRTSLAWVLSEHAIYFVDLYDVQRKLQRYDLALGTVTNTPELLPNVVFTSTMTRSATSHVIVFPHWSPTSGSRIVTLQPQT